MPVIDKIHATTNTHILDTIKLWHIKWTHMEGNKTPLQLDQQNILPGNIQNIISKNRNPVFNTETGTSHHITYNIKIKKYEAILDIQNNDDTEHVARSKMALRYNTKMQKNHYA